MRPGQGCRIPGPQAPIWASLTRKGASKGLLGHGNPSPQYPQRPQPPPPPPQRPQQQFPQRPQQHGRHGDAQHLRQQRRFPLRRHAEPRCVESISI